MTELPETLNDIWAKSPSKGEGDEAETLARHTRYVLERLADFAGLRPEMAQQCNMPGFWHVLYWSAFFHDFGKVMPAFQGVLRGDKNMKDKWSGHRHEVFSLAFLDWIDEGLAVEERQLMIANIVSHHRDCDDINALYPEDLFDEDDVDLLEEQMGDLPADHINALHQWTIQCGWEWACQLSFDSLGVRPLQISRSAGNWNADGRAAGIHKALRLYRKLVRSLTKKDKADVQPYILMRGLLISADYSASAHASRLPEVHYTTQMIFKASNIREHDLFEHQKKAMQTLGCALLTAPTGSGKTEAALLWAAYQSKQNNDRLPRLFYTLPYQASMNAMKIRLEQCFGDENVGLQHGRSLLALYRMLLEKKYEPQAAAKQAKWMRNLAKLHYPPVRVFSPYQMLKAMYRLKGYEAMLVDYFNAVFIFDEIHAYEVRRLAMILKMVSYLREFYHARFLFMSATFPPLIKKWLQEALDSPAEVNAQSEIFRRFQRHRLNLLDGEVIDDNNILRIIEDALSGKSVLVVCNIVARAQDVFRKLKEKLDAKGIDIELLHGRFNMRDRSEKERLVQLTSGSKSRERRPIVLVATQVVEVSLDIDLDTIYSEPAPLEALLQRFGRINRRCLQKNLAVVNVFSQPVDGQKIYDERLVAASLKILNKENDKPLDESSVSSWLAEIYSGEIASVWENEFQRAGNEFESTCIQTMKPFQSDKLLETEFYKAFDGVEVLPQELLDEYLLLKDDDPILSAELLVPISWGRYMAMLTKGKILAGDKRMPPVALGQYSSHFGLTFDEDLQDMED